MINYYEKFIKPKEIKKDINYYYDLLVSIINNDLYPRYLYNIRKKINNNEFMLDNSLSRSYKTKLKFKNDKIIVRFLIDDEKNSNININNLIYSNYTINNINIELNIILKNKEFNNKLLYEDNKIYHELRKNINYINNFFISNFRKSEENKYKIIHKRILNIDKKNNNEWNRLIYFLLNCTDPYFYKTLFKFKKIIRGIKFNTLDMKFKMIHQTQFFQRYSQHKQIKINKFLKSIEKQLNEKEIIYLCNELSECFGHTIINLNESIFFLNSLITHFNMVCHFKEMTINKIIIQD